MEIKKLSWVGSAKADLKSFPEEVQDEIGYSLYEIQMGEFPSNGKILHGFKGVLEIISNFDKNTYRVIYATKLGKTIYVLHSFQKKSKQGSKTPREELALIKHRLYLARRIERDSHE